MEKLRIICRLCLQKCVDFKAVEAYVKDVLDILLLKINLAVSEDPVMCTSCAAMLMRCFEFKATCFYTHDYIVPFLDGEKISKLDLRKLYMNKYETVDIPDGHGVCGLCMGVDKKCMAVCLDNDGDVSKELMEKCLPELDLSNIAEPIICAACCESLKTCFHFVTSCLIVEEKVMEYRKLTGADIIEIADVLQLTSRNVSKVEEDGTAIDVTTTEGKFCVDTGNADGHKNGSFVHVEEQKFLLNQDLEMKTDQYDFDRCLDNVVSSQSITTKSRGKERKKESPLKPRNKHKKARNVDKNPTEIEIHQCDSCSFRSTYKGNLRRHMLTHKLSSETTMYQCHSCSFKSKYKHGLTKHTLIHKDPSEVTMYKCTSCPYQAKLKYYLKEHSLIHKEPSEMRLYQCDACLFHTNFKGILQKHMLTHKLPSETTMYKCSSCSFTSKYKQSITRHMVTHKDSSEVKMYKCMSCPYQAKRKGQLKRHLLIHKEPSEIRQYHCDACSFHSIYRANLQRHTLTHKLPSAHQCYSCSFKTKYKQKLVKHITLNHKDH